MSEKSGNKPLTPKQELFVQGLFKGLSQREAYKQAYDAGNMKDNTIDRKAYGLYQKDYIRARLKELQENLSQRNTLTVEWVLNNLQEVAERCMQATAVTDREGNETGEYKFEHAGANKSLELIGKHLGMFVDKVESKNTNDNTTTDLTNMTEEERKKRIAELLNK